MKESEEKVTWTPGAIAAAESPYYPMCEDGPLCPLLDDPDFLFQVYIDGGLRKPVKRFLKTQRWPGRPQRTGYVMTEDSLRVLLHSMCNSAGARHRLNGQHKNLRLHNAIWVWLRHIDKNLLGLALEIGHHEGKKCFMTPAELGRFLDAGQKARLETDHARLHYVSVAFAMLQPKQRNELLAELLGRFPKLAADLGLGLAEDSLADPGNTEEYRLSDPAENPPLSVCPQP